MDSIFECQICYRGFNHTDKKPLSLPCGHTFCHECLTKLNKHGIIKCPFDKGAHHCMVDNLPVNYTVLTALPMNSSSTPKPDAAGGVQMCKLHAQKKVKFFCKNDGEMFCSKCVLKHTNLKHEVMACSFKSKYS